MILMLLTLFMSTYVVAKDNDSLVKEIIVHKTDEVFRYTYYYDSYNKVTIENKYKVTDGYSNPFSRTEWVYSNGLCISQLDYVILDGNWNLSHKIQFDFFEDRKVKEQYFTIENNLEILYKTITFGYIDGKCSQIRTYHGEAIPLNLYKDVVCSYDADNKLVNQTFKFNTNEGNIIQSYNYIYNQQHLLDSLVVVDIKDDIAEKQTLTRYFYHSATQALTKQIQKKWDNLTTNWVNKTKLEYVYDESNRLKGEYYFHFTTLFWTPNSKYEYKYDSNGLLLEQAVYQPIYEKWRKIYTISYQDIEKNKPSIMESRYNFWGGETDAFIHNSIPFYFNDEMTIMQADRLELLYILQTDDLTTRYEGKIGWINIYPNPSNGVFYISTDKYRIDSWSVTNLSGQIVKTKQNNYHTGLVDLTQLSDGIYMFNAKTHEGQSLKQKIIIQRSR